MTFFTYPKIKWNCPKGHMHRAEGATAARPGRDLNDRSWLVCAVCPRGRVRMLSKACPGDSRPQIYAEEEEEEKSIVLIVR